MAYALAFAGAGSASAWCMAVALAVLLPATMALGTTARGRPGTVVRVALWGTGVVFVAAFSLALGLPATEGAGSPLTLGFPLRAAIVLYGAGALPMLVLPLVYAWTFEDEAFDTRRLREAGVAASAKENGATDGEPTLAGRSA